MDSDMIYFMENKRAYRLELDRIAAMVGRIEKWFKPAFVRFMYSQPPSTTVPTAAELALMPEWRRALLPKSLEEELSEDDITDTVTKIPASAEKIRLWKTEQLKEIVHKSKVYKGREVTDDTLALASTIFRCAMCKQCYTYTTAFVHRCNYDDKFGILFEDADGCLTRRCAADALEKVVSKAFKHVTPALITGTCWGGLHLTMQPICTGIIYLIRLDETGRPWPLKWRGITRT